MYEHRFFIKLRNSNNLDDTLTLKFRVCKSETANLWRKLLCRNFIGPFNSTDYQTIDKTFCLTGWQNKWGQNSYSRNLSVLCQHMNIAITIINEEVRPQGYERINLYFSEEKLKDPDVYRDIMNDIHHHFEVLIGQSWNPSHWYSNTTQRGKWGIEQINNLCHEIENTIRSIHRFENQNMRAPKNILLNFNGQRIDSPNSYGNPSSKIKYSDRQYNNDFIPETNPRFGTIIQYYSQLGKPHFDAFKDNDQYIDKSNISAHIYQSGEAQVSFVCTEPKDILSVTNKSGVSFGQWLTDNGWNPQDKRLALGYVPLAELDFRDFPGMSNEEIYDMLENYDDLFSIGFVDKYNDVIVQSKYDYTWKDQYEAIRNRHQRN